jgi:hypothetical protein
MKDITYRLKAGQTVDLIPSISRFAANGHYQIVSRRPADWESPQYRIKSRHDAPRTRGCGERSHPGG